jgi:hypothetical protein
MCRSATTLLEFEKRPSNVGRLVEADAVYAERRLGAGLSRVHVVCVLRQSQATIRACLAIPPNSRTFEFCHRGRQTGPIGPDNCHARPRHGIGHCLTPPDAQPLVVSTANLARVSYLLKAVSDLSPGVATTTVVRRTYCSAQKPRIRSFATVPDGNEIRRSSDDGTLRARRHFD